MVSSAESAADSNSDHSQLAEINPLLSTLADHLVTVQQRLRTIELVSRWSRDVCADPTIGNHAWKAELLAYIKHSAASVMGAFSNRDTDNNDSSVTITHVIHVRNF